MSGHNRWTKIKRKKEAMGATKGKLFNKIIKELTVAARLSGGDPAGNARLRVAMDAAKEANMPSDHIQRAIKKGTGELEGTHYEEVRYEGYGPAGVAMIVECLTDNRSRTVADVRAAFSRGGGNMAAEHAVAWMFHRKGSIAVKPGPSEDQVMEKAIDAGAEDVINHAADGFEVRTEPDSLHAVATALQQAGLKLGEQKWIFVPESTIKLEAAGARKMLKLVELIEDCDDVQHVHANFELDDALIEQLAAE